MQTYFMVAADFDSCQLNSTRAGLVHGYCLIQLCLRLTQLACALHRASEQNICIGKFIKGILLVACKIPSWLQMALADTLPYEAHASCR